MKNRRTRGFSLLELLIVISALAIVVGVGYIAFPRERLQVGQAVERFQRVIEKAKFDAIERNTYVTVSMSSVDGDEFYEVAERDSGRVLEHVDLDEGDDAQVTFALNTEAASISLLFDSRGVGYGEILSDGTVQTLGDGDLIVTFGHERSEHERAVEVNQYGRTQFQ